MPTSSSLTQKMTVQIVNKDSALLNIVAEEQIGVYANHMEMCRFSSSDPMYSTVMIRIKRMLSYDSPRPCT